MSTDVPRNQEVSGRLPWILTRVVTVCSVASACLWFGASNAAWAESVWEQRAAPMRRATPVSRGDEPLTPSASPASASIDAGDAHVPVALDVAPVQISTQLEGRYDADGDGWLDARECLTYLQDRAEIVRTEGRVSVHTLLEEVYDADGNGVLEGDEAQALLSDAANRK